MTRQGREPPCVCEVTYPTASRITFTVTTGHHDVCEYIEYAWLVRFCASFSQTVYNAEASACGAESSLRKISIGRQAVTTLIQFLLIRASF